MSEIIENYQVNEIRTIRDLRELFPNVEATKNNWLFLSTEGYHGTKITLDDLEAILRDEHDLTKSIDDRYWLTVLIVHPREICAKVGLLTYGEIMVDIDDVPWLREMVRATLKHVEESQYGNL